MLARALDGWWRSLGSPDPFVVVEAGAGTATLAVSVLAAAPACGPALHYVLVERSEALRALQGRHLHLEPARQVLGPVFGEEEDRHPAAGTGPVVTALEDLPALALPRGTGVVLANELLDNLPAKLLERTAGGWSEVRVGLASGDDGFHEVLVPAADDLVASADRFAADAPVGGRIPLQVAAADWLRSALAVVPGGRVVAIDYADTTPSLARRPWTDWLRTYRAHDRGGPVLELVGEQDVTCEVAVDQLAAVRPVASDRSQADFLRANGIDDLVEEGRRLWSERASVGDLDAVRARSRVTESEALLDPGGLGAFRVLEWS